MKSQTLREHHKEPIEPTNGEGKDNAVYKPSKSKTKCRCGTKRTSIRMTKNELKETAMTKYKFLTSTSSVETNLQDVTGLPVDVRRPPGPKCSSKHQIKIFSADEKPTYSAQHQVGSKAREFGKARSKKCCRKELSCRSRPNEQLQNCSRQKNILLYAFSSTTRN